MWIKCKDQMPEDMMPVIALYLGRWPGRGNSGITEANAVDGEWEDIPKSVVIIGWMPIPDTKHLPIAECYASLNLNATPSRFLGSIQTGDFPDISECIFEGDYSEIK